MIPGRPEPERRPSKPLMALGCLILAPAFVEWLAIGSYVTKANRRFALQIFELAPHNWHLYALVASPALAVALFAWVWWNSNTPDTGMRLVARSGAIASVVLIAFGLLASLRGS